MKAAGTQSVVRSLSGATSDDRAAAIAAAIEALGQGRLVVFPTDTLYGIAAAANSQPALDRLAALTARTRGDRPGVATWHAPSQEAAWETIRPEAPVHKRLMRRLLPGPVTFVVHRQPDELEQIRESLGGVPGSLSIASEMAFRVPDSTVAQEFLAAAAAAGITVVADGLSAAGFAKGTGITDEVRAALDSQPDDAAIALALDDGPTKWSRPSTTIRLKPDGGYEVLYEGALAGRIIRKQLERTILFICTGNTCRSPMAEAIARHVLATRPRESGLTLRVRSAGATATAGAPVSPEGVRALSRMGVDVTELQRHRSRELTRQEIADADVIYAMTAGHARAVQAIDPTAGDKVRLLDPAGEDVPDPIGAPLDVYTRTAELLKDLIERRLKEEE